MLYPRGAYGYGNIGDDAILLSIQQRERDVCYLADHRAFGQIVQFSYGIDFKLFPSDLKGGERVAFGGGTLINARSFPENHYCKQALDCIERGCEVIWYSIGVDSINDPGLVKEAMERSSSISVRDVESKKLLRGIGVTKPIEVTGDPVEWWDMPVQGVRPDSKLIGINLTSVEEYTFENCVQMIQAVLAATDFKVRLYPFSRHVIDLREDDSQLLNKLLVELNTRRVHLYSGPHHPVDILESMKDLRAFIGSRLHSVIFAHKLGLMTIGVSSLSKSRRFLDKYDYPSFDISKEEQVWSLADLLINFVKRPVTGVSYTKVPRRKDSRLFYLREQIEHRQQQIAILQDELYDWETGVEQTQQEITRLQDEVHDQQGNMEQRQEEIAELKSQLREWEGKAEQRQEEIAELQSELREWEGKVEEREREVVGLLDRLSKLEARLKQRQQEIAGFLDRLSKSEARAEQRQQEIAKLQDKLNESEARAKQRQQEIAKLQNKLNESEASVEQRQQQITGLQSRLNETEAALRTIRESFGWSIAQYLRRLVQRVFHAGSRRYKLWMMIRKALVIWVRDGFGSFIGKIFKKAWSVGPGALVKVVRLPGIRLPARFSAGSRKESHTTPAEQIDTSEKSKVWLNNDYPHGNAEFTPEINGVIDVSGWAIAEKGISVVSVYCDNQLQGIAGYGSTRVDVAAAYPKIPHSAASGYHFIWDSSKVFNDVHVLKIVTRSTDGSLAESLVKVRTNNSHTAYDRWQERNMVRPSAVRWMKTVSREFSYRPCISLLLFQRDSDTELFNSTLTSLLNQAYSDWELWVACDTGLYKKTGSKLKEITKTEPRVKILVDDFQNNAQAWNKLLVQSSGELVGVIDEGDRLQCNALFETVYQFNLKKDTDIVYSDEDIILKNCQRVQPSFKPGWSPDLLLNMNYIGRLWISRRSLVQEAGGFREGDGAASEYGLLLRLVEKSDKVGSVKTVLYSRWWANCQDGSQQAKKVLQKTMKRRGIAGEVKAGPIEGTYRVKRDIKGQPLVSLLIPTRGNLQYLRPCLESITAKSTYPNYEIIIIDNNRALPDETKEYYKSLPHKIVRWYQPFNWSRVNNFAAKEATGDYLIFLNDDTEVIAPEWIEALLEHAQRPEVAAVGAKLLYTDGTVQHAGMFLVDSGGGARHAFRHLQADNPGYLGLASLQRNCSLVTGACLMIRRKVFEEMGGFNKEFGISNNDADFCLRALKKGYLVMYTPYSLLYHHEKVTRKDISEKADNDKFWGIWRSQLEQGDYYYNPNLSLESDLFDINERQFSITYADWPPLEKDEIKKILVVKLDHLGDVLLSLPAIRRLRQLFPDADITALVGNWSKSFLTHEPAIDRVLTYDGFFSADSSKPPRLLAEKEKQEITKWLAGYRFDLAIDLRRHTETREFLTLSCARYTAGFANYNEFPWLTIALPYERDQNMYHPRRHITQDLVSLVEFVTAGSDGHLNTTFSAELQQSVESLVKSLAIPNNRLIIGVHPGVGQPIRRWPIEYFARFADLLCERLDASVLVFGTKSEKKLADGIISKMNHKDRAFSLAGKLSFNAFLYLLKKCNLFVGNNSGPVHMAASLGVPTIGIYAGTSHVKEWGPIGPRALAVHLEVGCSPCYLVRPGDCPYDIKCLQYIFPEQVWQAALRMLVPNLR